VRLTLRIVLLPKLVVKYRPGKYSRKVSASASLPCPSFLYSARKPSPIEFRQLHVDIVYLVVIRVVPPQYRFPCGTSHFFRVNRRDPNGADISTNAFRVDMGIVTYAL